MVTPTAPPCPPSLPKQGYAGPSQFGPQLSPCPAMGPLACPKRVTKQAQPCCSLFWVVIGLANPHSNTMPTKFAQTRLRSPQPVWPPAQPLVCNGPPGMPHKGY